MGRTKISQDNNARIDRLDSIVDMLRNEKPCYLWYQNPTMAAIYTGQEPIGEEETEE